MNAPPVRIDRRPLGLVLLERSARWIVYGALFWLLYRSTGAPWAQTLSPQAQRALAIFLVCLILWVFHLLPLMVTSILAIVLPALLEVLPPKEVFALFGNHVIFFLLGTFILAAALSACGLAERITLLALELAGGSPRRLSLGIFLTGALLSTVMSEHAVAALLFPIVLELCRALELDPRRSNLGRLFFLCMAWGCIVGGVLTLLGGARAPLAIGILEETTGQSIGFSEWTAAIWPVPLVVGTVGYLVLALSFPLGSEQATPAADFLQTRRRRLGRVSFKEQLVGVIMVTTIVAWVVWGQQIGLAEISLLAVVALFALRLISWREVEESVNWGVLLMYGGAIALGSTLAHSGAAEWIAQQVIAHGAISGFTLLALLAVVALALTESVSNTAVVSILLPLGLGLATSLSMDGRLIAYAVAVPAGLAFTLPMSTPAMALAYSSGFLRIRHVLFPGLVAIVLALGTFLLVVRFYWPLIGLGPF